jgi:cytochrome c oxidase cbb3-type subunit 3
MMRNFLLAFALYASVAGFLVSAQTGSTKPARGGNPEAAKIKNPVPSTPESIAQGRRTYQRLCSRCHGPEAKGDGSAGGAVQPPDLTDDKWDYGSTDGEIFSSIHDGTSPDMEGYASRISDTDIWNIVNYLRSIGPQK